MFADTAPIVLLNGLLIEADKARVSAFDRGYLMADGVYEGISVYNGRCIDNEAHLQRLERSLREIELQPQFDTQQIKQWQQQCIEANKVEQGFLYFQITRAVATREFHYPPDSQAQTFMFIKPLSLTENPLASKGVSVCLAEDLRWKRRDIKSIALLPQAMAKQKAAKRNCFEVWMEEDGYITEGSSTSALIVTDNTLIAPPLTPAILSGITRAAIIQLAQELGIAVELRHFSAKEAFLAQEAFLTSASNLVLPVVQVEGNQIANGRPGAVSKKLRQAYIEKYCV